MKGRNLYIIYLLGRCKGSLLCHFCDPHLVCVYMIIIQKKEGRRRYKKERIVAPQQERFWKLFLLLLCQLHRGSLCVDCVYTHTHTHTSPSNIHSCCHKTFFSYSSVARISKQGACPRFSASPVFVVFLKISNGCCTYKME